MDAASEGLYTGNTGETKLTRIKKKMIEEKYRRKILEIWRKYQGMVRKREKKETKLVY